MEKSFERKSSALRPKLATSHGKNSNPEDWLRDLVKSEAEFMRTGSYELVGYRDSQRAMEEATVFFLEELKDEFERCAFQFSKIRGGSHLPNTVKVFHVSQTPADFIVLRGTLKLLVSRSATGVVSFSFLTQSTPFFKGQPEKKRETVDLIAQMLPFREYAWMYHGERVNAKAVVRYFFTELVRSSAL